MLLVSRVLLLYLLLVMLVLHGALVLEEDDGGGDVLAGDAHGLDVAADQARLVPADHVLARERRDHRAHEEVADRRVGGSAQSKELEAADARERVLCVLDDREREGVDEAVGTGIPARIVEREQREDEVEEDLDFIVGGMLDAFASELHDKLRLLRVVPALVHEHLLHPHGVHLLCQRVGDERFMPQHEIACAIQLAHHLQLRRRIHHLPALRHRVPLQPR
mmetsp:Transcript_26421/g.53853  ORF Transcript_26421/g.53853 Transcript_26421/m.53853 type:complete len:221 (-) Transcript_26421:396-1058(-)